MSERTNARTGHPRVGSSPAGAERVRLSASRKAALRTLDIARERSAYVRELLSSPQGRSGVESLSEEDRAFAARLALGVTATSGTLDEAIDAHLAPKAKLTPDVRDALRIAAFELLFLGKTPHAAVSQGVELVKTRAKSAAGLANAVLRRVAEGADAFMAQSAAHRYGLPAWLVERVGAELGESRLADFGAAGLEQAPTFVASVPMWVNDKKASETLASAGLLVRPYGAVPGSWLAADTRSVATSPLVSGPEIKVVVADYGAQLVAYLGAPEPGDRMLEVGSGRGTKSILLAGHAHRRGGVARIWALDVHAGKGEAAAARLSLARVDGVTQVVGDARSLDGIAGLPPHLDRVLVDAPCSGTGTLRRHPEIAWSLTPDDVRACSALQADILASCARRVAPGGMLTYATCSVLREENEDVVAAFLASEAGAGFEVVPVSDIARSAGLADLADELADTRETPEGYLRTYPSVGGPDGHFCAVLRLRD
ncbi:MAG: antitermination protein NusB [Coriobacteriia bacterium]|nr:antitermination protein NusB [Coriobacteriia bacterium]